LKIEKGTTAVPMLATMSSSSRVAPM
jgi:hypothetical protein